MDAYPSVVGTLGGGGPVGWPWMNLEMHLHLNSELASNKFSLNLHLKPDRYRLVRQSREQATIGGTHASMSVGGHALPPYPLILKWLHPALPPPLTHTSSTTTTPVFPSSPVSSTVYGDEVWESQKRFAV